MRYEQAIRLVEKNEGKDFDFADYCVDSSLGFEELVCYLKTLERAGTNDYPCVIADIEAHLDSCGFSIDKYVEVINALGIADHFQILSVH